MTVARRERVRENIFQFQFRKQGQNLSQIRWCLADVY